MIARVLAYLRAILRGQPRPAHPGGAFCRRTSYVMSASLPRIAMAQRGCRRDCGRMIRECAWLRREARCGATGAAISICALLAPLLLSGLSAGCTPYIPVKPGFGTSALTPVGDIPPEYGEFNNFDPGVNRLLAGRPAVELEAHDEVNRLLATQLCATPYQPYEDKAIDAVPGRMVQAYGRCRNHVPLFGN